MIRGFDYSIHSHLLASPDLFKKVSLKISLSDIPEIIKIDIESINEYTNEELLSIVELLNQRNFKEILIKIAEKL